jgi:transposase-like protein
MSSRPLLFKWRHFEPQIILCAVRWYLRFSLSYREVAELLIERGIHVDHSTVWRWVQRYGPELDYVRVQGRWCYLYRAVDSEGATVEFFMSAFRDVEAAKSLFRRALRDGAIVSPASSTRIWRRPTHERWQS